MRVPRESLLFLGLMVALCALGGVVFGIATGKFVTQGVPRASATPFPATATTNNAASFLEVTATPTMLGVALVAATPLPTGAQKSIILIGVDDAQSPNPTLEGVWVITFQPGINEYYVISFPPSATFYLPSLSGSLTMRDIFAEDMRQQVGFRFVRDAVQSRFTGFDIQADVLLDREDFAGLVGTVGGVNWAGRLLGATDILASYDALPLDDNTSRMIFQEQLFQALFAALGEKGMTPENILGYIEQLPNVQSDAARVAALNAFITGAPQLPLSTPIWRSYQPELEISAQP